MFQFIKRKIQEWFPSLRSEEFGGYEYVSIPFPTAEEMHEYYTLIKEGKASNKDVKLLHAKKHAKVLVGNSGIYLHDLDQIKNCQGTFCKNGVHTTITVLDSAGNNGQDYFLTQKQYENEYLKKHS